MRNGPVPFFYEPFATPFGRFALAVFGGLFAVQSAIVVAGGVAHGTLDALPLAGALGSFALLTALSVLAACVFARDFAHRAPATPRLATLCALAGVLPVFFSTVSSTAFDAPKFHLLFAAAALLLSLAAGRAPRIPGLFGRAAPRLYGLFLLALLAGSFRGNTPAGLWTAALFALYGLLFLTAAEEGEGEGLAQILATLAAGSLVPLALGFAQYNGVEPTGVFQNPGERARVFSTLGNVNWYGSYLVLLASGCGALFLTLARPAGIALAASLGALALASAALTQSRAAWGALAVAAVAYAGLAAIARARRAAVAGGSAGPPERPDPAALVRRRAGAALALFCALLLLHFNTLSPLNRQFTMAERLRATFRGDHNVIQRGLVWRVTLDMFRDNPVAGIGTGAFARDYLEWQRRRFLADGDAALLPYGGNARETHNEYLQILAENGLAGFLPFALALVAFAAAALSLARAGAPARDAAPAFALFAGCAGILAEALLAFPFRVPVSGALLFLFAGLAWGRTPAARPAEGPARVPAEPAPWLRAALPSAALVASFLILVDLVADVSVMLGQERMKYGLHEAALPHLSRAARWNPLRGDARFLLGSCHLALGRDAEAEAQLAAALGLTNDRAIANNLGFLRQNRGDHAGALDWFTRAWLYEPRAAETANNVAMAARRLGDRAKARAFLDRAVAANPAYLTARNNLGDLLLEERAADSAEVQFAAIVSRNPDEAVMENFRRGVYAYADRGTLLAEYGRAYLGLAKAARMRGETDRAGRMFAESIKFLPDSPLLRLEAGLFELERGRPDAARPHLAAAAKSGGESGRKAAAALRRLEEGK